MTEQVEKKNDLRQVNRRCLVFYLRVYEAENNSILGYLVDISEKGVMLVSDGPLTIDKVYRLQMKLPSQMKDRNEITFTAKSRWCKIDSSSDFYLAGFEMSDIRPEAQKLVFNLIKDFGFNGEA